MKKMLLMVIFGIFAGTSVLIAQSKPIMGYDKVSWGVSIADIRTIYSLGDDVTADPDQDDSNIIKMTQTNVSTAIKQRIFMFIDDKLYRVTILYNDISDSNASNLESALKNKYGNQTDFDSQSQQMSMAFQTVYYKTLTTIFGQYEPDLEVALIQGTLYTATMEKDSTNMLGQNILVVRYTWKKFRDEYQAKMLGL